MKNRTNPEGLTRWWIHLARFHSIGCCPDIYQWQNNYKWCGLCYLTKFSIVAT